jgi:hypothetical protein
MNRFLTRSQLALLRRCDGGLRVWELAADLAALQAELNLLRELQLISFDEASGYETTMQGETCLVGFNPGVHRDSA